MWVGAQWGIGCRKLDCSLEVAFDQQDGTGHSQKKPKRWDLYLSSLRRGVNLSPKLDLQEVQFLFAQVYWLVWCKGLNC